MLEKKGNKLEYDIIHIIFKCYESNMYLIVLLPNYKCTYDQIDLIQNKLELFIANWFPIPMTNKGFSLHTRE